MADPYAAFERDVPLHLREDAMQMMAEMTGGYGSHDCITILERDQLDAINFRAHGIIEIEGREFTFQMEDGNRNGTVICDWNSGRPFEAHVPVRSALQPSQRLIDEAIESGRGNFLLLKWDAMLLRPQIAEIPGKYDYDRFFAPGEKTSRYWHDQAAKHHFVLVSEEKANETRAILANANGGHP